MKTLLITTAALSVGFTLGVSQAIQAADPSPDSQQNPGSSEAAPNSKDRQEALAAKRRLSKQGASKDLERKGKKPQHTEREEMERLERDQMRLQQLEHTEQTDFEQLEGDREREREIERERRDAQQSGSSDAPAPVSRDPANDEESHRAQEQEAFQRAQEQQEMQGAQEQ